MCGSLLYCRSFTSEVDKSEVIHASPIQIFYYSIHLQIHLVHNTTNDKPRGYAFIEYEHERDMHGEYRTIFCQCRPSILPLISVLLYFNIHVCCNLKRI